MRKTLTAAWLLLGGMTVFAADAPPMEEVVVSGEYAGPGLWKVTSPEHPEHVLWIVGEASPLPKRVKWRSKKVEQVLLQSQEVLMQSGILLKADQEIPMYQMHALVPALGTGVENPDQGLLRDHVSPDSYARWRVQKQRYLKRDQDVEKERPMVAADKLRTAAFRKLKLREGGIIWEVLGQLAHEHGIPVNSPRLVITFPADETRGRIRHLAKDEIADEECFDKSLELAELLGNRVVNEERARAWATGDVEKLMSLPKLPGYAWACQTAFMGAQSVSEYVPADVGEQVTTLWLETVEQLLGKNRSTLGVVALTWWLEPNGLMDRLRKRGLVVQAPEP
jgi:hypothetical protein